MLLVSLCFEEREMLSVLLQFVSQYASHVSIAVRLPFVSQYFLKNLLVVISGMFPNHADVLDIFENPLRGHPDPHAYVLDIFENRLRGHPDPQNPKSPPLRTPNIEKLEKPPWGSFLAKTFPAPSADLPYILPRGGHTKIYPF